MAKRKAARPNPYATWRQYPTPDARRGGCKVSWHYYADKAKADKCAEAARHNAVIAEREGFDFGYCAPGSLTRIPATAGIKHGGVDVSGMFEVCLP